MILTPMNQSALDHPDELQAKEAAIPWGRAGRPDEVADAGHLPALASGGLYHRHDRHDRWRAVADRRAGRLIDADLCRRAARRRHAAAAGPWRKDVDLMSPFVWQEARSLPDHGSRRALARSARPTRPGSSRAATVRTACHSRWTDQLAITPGPGADDLGGCEDPTVVVLPDGDIWSIYTGVDAARAQGSMILAVRPGPRCARQDASWC